MNATPEHMDNIVPVDFGNDGHERTYEHSPFGPIQKYGKQIIERAQDAQTTAARQPINRYQMQYFSNIAAAIERTDITDPRQPFIDF